MAYSETISTQKYPSSSSTRYCRFDLVISCETIVSQTGYVDLNYKLDFYSRSSSSYGSWELYQANDVVFSINGETLFSGAGPYVPTGMFSSTITLKEGTFRALLDENGKPHFDMAITSVLKFGSGGSPIDYNYTQSVILPVTNTLYYSRTGAAPEHNYQSDAYATWTLETQDILENSSCLSLLLETTDRSSAETYYAKITALNGPRKGAQTTLTLLGGNYKRTSTTLNIVHPTSSSEVARFRMEVGIIKTGGGGYPGGGGWNPGGSGSSYNQSTTAEFTLPKIFRNIAEIYVDGSFKTVKVYVYKNGAWRRAQPYVFTDGSYVSA